MTASFLQGAKSRLDEVDRSLQVLKPADDAYEKPKRDIVISLEEAELNCIINLRPTSAAAEFVDLQETVIRMRDLSCKIINMESRDPQQPLGLLVKASELLNKLDSHIFVLNHVTPLQGRPASISADVSSLGPSMTEIMARLDSFRVEVKKYLFPPV